MSSVRRSLALSAIDSYLAMVLQIGSTVILARMLTPEQTGIFAVAAVFAALASTFRDFGVGEYLIQQREVTTTMLRAAFAVSLIVSWAMAVVMALIAPVVGDFYRNEGVRDVMHVLALNFLLIPFGAVPLAWARRELNFRPILLSSVVGNVSSFGVSILLAWRGHGFMSLAWASLAGTVGTVLVAVATRPADMPRRPGWQGIAQVFHFGKFASGVYIFGQVGKGAPEMILGRVLDMAGVGVFSRANGPIEIFNRLTMRALMPVYLPYFSRGVREAGHLRDSLGKSISMLTVVGWPFLLLMGVAAYPAIRLIYGTQWLDAVPLTRLLCVAGAIELAYFPAKEALLALGMARESNALQMRIQALRVAGIFAAIPFGLAGACWGLLAAALAGALLSHRDLVRLAGWTTADAWGAMRQSALASLLTVGPVLLASRFVNVGEHNYLAAGAAAAVLGSALWMASVVGMRHPLWAELRHMARRKR